jgi:hypothetical protein
LKLHSEGKLLLTLRVPHLDEVLLALVELYNAGLYNFNVCRNEVEVLVIVGGVIEEVES